MIRFIKQFGHIEARRLQCLLARRGGFLSVIDYKGFGGVPLSADVLGDDNDPAVLLIPDVGQSRAAWRDVADALVLSGRRVVNLDLRETASERRTDAHIEDLRLVLAQMGSRPVVVAAGAADGSRRARWRPTARIWRRASCSSTCRSTMTRSRAASRRNWPIPTLVVRGGFSPAQVQRGQRRLQCRAADRRICRHRRTRTSR
jgi:hypothetical protein